MIIAVKRRRLPPSLAGKDTNHFCPPHLVDPNTVPRAWSSGRHHGRSGTTQSEKGKEKAATSNIAETQPISGSYNRSSRARALAQQREIQARNQLKLFVHGLMFWHTPRLRECIIDIG